ncbi:MAG: GTP pyrophosphokinase family protein [Clostridia bacterium]|nr:GTP pyrophosphokinase family protein [Clostridia bacterium]
MSIYGKYYNAMTGIMNDLAKTIEANSRKHEEETGEKLFEHLCCRIKSPESMLEKLEKKGLEATTYHALRSVTDAIGLRIVCLFIDDIYENIALIKSIPGCTVVREKDYIQNAKPNGYRSYHMVLDRITDAPDVDGNTPGHFFIEVQLRTIAMDTWAALEHELKYKRNIKNQDLIVQELHRCANELAACDVSMQTLRKIIRGQSGGVYEGFTCGR